MKKIFLILAFTGITAISFAAIIMQPYLQAVTKDSLYVMVETDSKAPVEAQYGMSDSYGNTATTAFYLPTTHKNSYVQRIKLGGLLPDTIYHYRVAQRGVPWTDDRYFKTAPPEGKLFKFAFAADFRTGTAIHDKISAEIKKYGPGLCLYGGDLCLDGTYDSFKSEFFRPYELALISGAPFFCAVGNHEGWTANTKAFLQAPDSASGSQSYYSFDYGDMHVLVLDNYDPGGYAKGSPQYEFAAKDLSGTKKKWKVVICHNPPYCGDQKHGEDKIMIGMASSIFEPCGVDVVISGHSHLFQHNFVHGIHYMIIGSAGAPLYAPIPEPYTVKTAESYCYATGSADQCDFGMTIYDQDNTVLDILQLRKCQDIIHSFRGFKGLHHSH
jgi:predicted phosphodiesterase